MELVGFQVDGAYLLIGDLYILGVLVPVQYTADLEPRPRLGGRDETDDGRVREQGLTAPVLGDEGEEPVLDFVPLAGSRREMAGRNDQARLLGQLLEFPLPEAEAGPVAPPTVGGDEERGGARVMPAAEGAPPPPDRGHGEGGGVVVGADGYPAGVGGEVVDPVRDGLAELLVRKVWVLTGSG